MSLRSLSAFVRTRAGRALLASIGLVLLGTLIAHAGADEVWASVQRTATRLPFLVLLEGCVLLCDVAALSSLYRDQRPPFRVVLRATLISAPITALVPAGRTWAEGVKAAILAPYGLGGARTLVAAVQLQSTILLSNGLITIGPAIAAGLILGHPLIGGIIAGNSTLMFIFGFSMIFAARGLGIGAWVGRRWERAAKVGPELDAMWREEPLIRWPTLAFELLARCCTVLELAILISAFVPLELARVLAADGVLMVGGSVGDVLPAQLGIADANFIFSSKVLGLSPSEALSIPLLMRVGPFTWAAIGALVPVLWMRRQPA